MDFISTQNVPPGDGMKYLRNVFMEWREADVLIRVSMSSQTCIPSIARREW